MEDFIDKIKVSLELKERIRKLKKEIDGLESVKESIGWYGEQITTSMEDWELQYGEYTQLDLAPDINVTDYFEGMAAEQLALDVPPAVTEINDLYSSMSEVMAGIGDQIPKIDEYITELNEQITELNNQLDALW